MDGKRTRAIIALGANRPSEQGSPMETLEAALALLESRGVEIIARSRWFASPAWPEGSGPDYVNGAAEVASILSPNALLGLFHKIETMLGRERVGGERWASRPCDIDLIASGSMLSPGEIEWRRVADGPPEAPRETLILPHPQMHRRAFVLIPMADIALGWRHPLLGKSVSELLMGLPECDRESVTAIA